MARNIEREIDCKKHKNKASTLQIKIFNNSVRSMKIRDRNLSPSRLIIIRPLVHRIESFATQVVCAKQLFVVHILHASSLFLFPSSLDSFFFLCTDWVWVVCRIMFNFQIIFMCSWFLWRCAGINKTLEGFIRELMGWTLRFAMSYWHSYIARWRLVAFHEIPFRSRCQINFQYVIERWDEMRSLLS